MGNKNCTLILWLLFFSALPSYAGGGDDGGGKGGRSQSQQIVTTKECESFLLENSMDGSAQALFTNYLFSEPLSEYILKQLIRDKFNIHHAAISPFNYDEEKRLEASEKIFSYLNQWFSEKVSTVPKKQQIKLSGQLEMGFYEFCYIAEIFLKKDNIKQQQYENLKKDFIRILTYNFHLYMKFLDASKVSWRLNIILRRSPSQDYRILYIDGLFIPSFGVGITEHVLFHGGLPYYTLGAAGFFMTLPWVALPALTYAYEKTLGRLQKYMFLKKRFPQALPLGPQFQNAWAESFPELKPALPQISSERSLSPKEREESLRDVKDILSDIQKTLGLISENLQKADAGITIASSLKFGEEFWQIQRFLYEAEDVLSKTERNDEMNWMDGLQGIILLEKMLFEHLDSTLDKGLEIYEQIKDDTHKQQPNILGVRMVKLHDLKTLLLAQLGHFKAVLEQTVQEQLKE